MFSPHEKAMAIGVIKRLLDEMLNAPTTTKCLHCIHYGAVSLCNKWGEEIPHEVYETGCDAWEFNPQAPISE